MAPDQHAIGDRKPNMTSMNQNEPDATQPVVEHLPQKATRSPAKSLLIGILTALMVLYLVNPTAGVFEFIPDNFPVVGNLDEATATAVLLGCLSYFGIELPWLRTNRNR